MKMKRQIVLLGLALLIALQCFAQTAEEEKDAIVELIEESYIGAAYNNIDIAVVKKGFHENFTWQGLHHDRLFTTNLRQWIILLEREKWLRPDWNNRTTAEISVIGIEGNAAVAKVDVFNNRVHELTDFLSVYKFADSWKITNRIADRHEIPSEVAYERQVERENSINEKLQPPEKVMDAIGVKPGMTIGEVGAGHGRYTVHLARRVGHRGKILANDIDKAVGTVTTSSPEAYKLFIQATEFLFTFNNKECIALLEKALEYDPDFVNAYFMLAAAYYNSGFASKAYEYSRKTFDLRERLTDRMKYRIEGDFYLRREETYPDAIDAYKKLLDLYPDDTTGNNMLGGLYSAIGEWDKAIEYRKVNVDNNIGLWLYHYTLSLAYIQKGLFNEAREVALNYLNNFGELAPVHQLIAETYMYEGKLDLSLEEVEKAFAMDPSNPRYQFYRASIYLFKDSFEAAEKEYKELAANHYQQTQHRALQCLAALSLHRGRYQDAAGYFKNAAAIAETLGEDNWTFSDKRSLIRIFGLMEKYEEADKLSQDVFSNPGNLDLSEFRSWGSG